MKLKHNLHVVCPVKVMRENTKWLLVQQEVACFILVWQVAACFILVWWEVACFITCGFNYLGSCDWYVTASFNHYRLLDQ